MKYKLMVVENETDVFYCHNDKCALLNIEHGCCGFEERARPTCPACNKRVYSKPHQDKGLGNCEVDL